MNPVTPYWLNTVLRYVAFVMVLYVYSLLIEAIGGFSSSNLYQQWLELLLVVYLYGLFYAFIKPVPWRAVIAATPILLLYLVHDVFYLAFGKVFRFINISELPELLQVLPLNYTVLVILLLAIPAVVYFIVTHYRQPLRQLLWSLPLFLLLVMIEAMPQAYVSGYQQISSGLVKYSDGKSVENNGRLTMMLFREAQRVATVDRLAPYRSRQSLDNEITSEVNALQSYQNNRNVHLVVLESFLDPRLFSKLGFSRSPAHPDFDALFGDRLGLSRSPVFGGATAQAEFEVLCGVPAFEKVSSVEFNAFTGAGTNCLPAVLTRLGYRSVASNAYKPNFFNARSGYQGAGFSEQFFPQEFSGALDSYLHFGDPGEEEYLFDATLFKQNLAFVKKHLASQQAKPLFNYLMTIYGHTPHLLDSNKRPELIQLQSDYPDDHLQRAANQFYYRTQAIAVYVKQLMTLDKDSLIILVSDHVPPLRNGPNTYRALAYMDNIEHSYYYNRIAIIEQGKVKKYPTLRHYELPSLVLNYLSNGHYCESNRCGFVNPTRRRARDDYLQDYLQLMAHASQ